MPGGHTMYAGGSFGHVANDGSAVVVGVVCLSPCDGTTDSSLFTAKFTPAGALDATYGTGGVAYVSPTAGDQFMLGGAVGQPDGKIIVTYTGNATGGFGPPLTAFATRISTTGTIDATFGGASGFSITTADNLAFNAPALDGAGNVYVAGETMDPNTFANSPVVAKLSSAGTLVAGFGNAGVATATASDISSGQLNGIQVAGDGSIVAIGSYQNTSFYSVHLMVRFNASGTQDGAFSSGVAIPITGTSGDSTSLVDLAILSNGQYLTAGSTGEGGSVDPQIYVVNP